MPKYTVEVTRTSSKSINFEVEADNREDAVSRAIEKACDTEFPSGEAEYEGVAVPLEPEDIHAIAAARIFGKSAENITPAERRVGKMSNHGKIYGLSGSALAAAIERD